MDIIGKDQFDSAKDMDSKGFLSQDDAKIKPPTAEEFKKLLEDMQNPVKAQQEIAAKLKNFLDQRIEKELGSTGSLSNGTRMWVESYNNLLEKIQKAIHGEKSVNLHLVKVSHSDISEKIRESIFDLANPEEIEKENKKEIAN